MVTGGHTVGTAQLAATASTMDTPESLSNVTNSPSTDTAVMSSFAAGHSCELSRDAITALRSSSPMVFVFSAIAPMRAIAARSSRERRAATPQRRIWATPSLAASSVPALASCRSYSSSSGVGPVTWAATTEPAEVPTNRSASVRSTPASANPARIPSSQATPVTPPPPSTNALPATLTSSDIRCAHRNSVGRVADVQQHDSHDDQDDADQLQ